MRTLTVTALAEIAQLMGTEPINIVEIEWTDNATRLYADRDLENIPGKITELGSVDGVLSSKTGKSFSVKVALDDTDGEVLGICNNFDIQKRPARLYQYFGDINLPDKFLIYSGLIQTPFTWSEGTRIVDFEIVNMIEDIEVGFSPEQGEFPSVSYELVGKPWPLIFGSPLHVPAAKAHQQRTGTLRFPMTIVDPVLFYKRDALIRGWNDMLNVRYFFKLAMDGAYLIAPQIKDILIDLIATIKEEDVILTKVIRIIRGFENLKKKIAKDPFNLFLKAQLLQQAGNPQNEAKPMIALQAHKEFLRSMIERIKLKQKILKEAIKKQLEATDALVQIYGKYVQVINEICFEEKYASDVNIEVQNGDLFPQNTSLDVIINNVKWRGTFSGTTFHRSLTPLPVYKDFKPGPFVHVLNDCGEPNYDADINTFYVPDTTYRLKGMYCLVHSKLDGQHHIIKVKDQIGTKCTFDLIRKEDKGETDFVPTVKGNSFIKVDPQYSIPQYSVPRTLPDKLGIPDPTKFNQYISVLPDDVLAALAPAVPNDDELKMLMELVQLRKHDIGTPTTLIIYVPTYRDVFTVIGEDIDYIYQVSGIPLNDWWSNPLWWGEIPKSGFWEAQGGDTVYLAGDEKEVYVANILPSEILSVYAKRTKTDGPNPQSEDVFAPVPSSYYTKDENHDLGYFHVTTLTFPIALSRIEGEGWSDDIYVTLRSSVGPNISDVLKYLVNTYTRFTCDVSSFAYFATLQNNYPVNFAILDRKNIFEVLNDIAWQARSVVYEKNGVFFAKYLSIEPSTDKVITEANIEEGSLVQALSNTDSLVTKLTAEWKATYLPEDEDRTQQLVYRHNIAKYGYHDKTIKFTIYNSGSLVEKSATYWLIQMANTWKLVSFTTFLENIELEVFDCIELNLAKNYFFNSPMKAVIEKLDYHTDKHQITIDAWLPVRAGEMDKYLFAWPASAETDAEFPTADDIAKGYVFRFPVTGDL